MAEIDNKKMWAFMAKAFGMDTEFGLAIRDALKEQCLEYENGKIVSIEPELKEKDGNWYRCTQCVENFCAGGFIRAK